MKYEYNLPKGKEFTKKDKEIIRNIVKWFLIGIMCGLCLVVSYLIILKITQYYPIPASFWGIVGVK